MDKFVQQTPIAAVRLEHAVDSGDLLLQELKRSRSAGSMLPDKRAGEPLEAENSKQARFAHGAPRPGASSASGNSAATQSAGSQHQEAPAEEVAVESVPQLQLQAHPQPKLEGPHDYLQEPQAAPQQQHMVQELPPLLFQPELPANGAPEPMGPGPGGAQLILPPHQLPSATDIHNQSAVPEPLAALQQATALSMEGAVHPHSEGLMYDMSQPGASLMMPSIVAAALSQQGAMGSELPVATQSGTPLQDALSDPGDRPYRCPEPGCGFASKRKSNLTVHSRIHTRPRPPRRCRHPGCDFVAGEGCNLKEHQRMHAGEKPYRCSQEGCDASFARVDHLTVHMRTHTGEKPYTCTHPGCNFAAAQQSNLHRHMQSHSSDKPYKCSEPGCSAAFSQSSNLVRHQRAHRGEKRFHCSHPGCNFAAAQLANVKRHMQGHTGERPYHCDWPNCASAFSQLANLVRHKRIHTAEKPYKCDQEGCMYSAAQRSNLHRHMQAAHGQNAPLDGIQAAPVDPSQGNLIHQAQEHVGPLHHTQEHAAAMHPQQAASLQQEHMGTDGQAMQTVSQQQAMVSDEQAMQAAHDAVHALAAAVSQVPAAPSNPDMVMNSAG